MKRTIIMATAATAMLAGCMKTEVNPVVMPAQEISYQAVTGPNTKADNLDPNGFSTNNVFMSYAYRLLGTDKTWENNKSEAEVHIPGATIGYSKTEDSPVGVWRSTGNDRYYWPNEGTVTFFAWSNNKAKDDTHATSLVAGTVGCEKETGIKVTDYNALSNKNFDFMVADIQKDLSSNGQTYGYTGVPTLFRHKMCQVKYSIKTNVLYTITDFWIDELSFENIYQTADYSQFDYDEWKTKGTPVKFTYNSSNYNEALSVNAYPEEAHWTTLPCEDQFYFIPQMFNDDASIKIQYSIQTGEGVKTNVTNTKKLKDIFPEGWKKNKIYTINITVGLNEILWDPSIVDWESGTDADWPLIDPGKTEDEGAGE